MRFLHRIYARFMGYFWLPCPACGKMFGGHEAFHTRTVLVGGRSMVTCGCIDLIPLAFDEARYPVPLPVLPARSEGGEGT